MGRSDITPLEPIHLRRSLSTEQVKFLKNYKIRPPG
jgi:hypothetical protein